MVNKVLLLLKQKSRHVRLINYILQSDYGSLVNVGSGLTRSRLDTPGCTFAFASSVNVCVLAFRPIQMGH